MFHGEALAVLAREHEVTFQQLIMVEDTLNARFSGLEEAIRGLVLSVASGEPLLLIGPPGTGKSKLIRAFCGLMGLLEEEDPGAAHPDYFEYLLTPFTEPGELFGFYNIAAARDNRLEREETGMMQNARVVYLDEVFNGSSAILNSILAFINERIFHDRGVRKRVRMQCLFAATNHIPETSDLRAVFDRFVLRCSLENVDAQVAPIRDLARAGWVETFGQKTRQSELGDLLPRVEAFRGAVRTLTTNGGLVPEEESPIYAALSQMVRHARQYDLSAMSNRRLIKLGYVMMVHRIYEAVLEGEVGPLHLRERELQLFPRFFLDRFDEEAVAKMMRVVLP